MRTNEENNEELDFKFLCLIMP